MVDKERLQRIGELLADLMRSSDGEEKPHKLFDDAQLALENALSGLSFPPDVAILNKNDRFGFFLTIKNPSGSAVIYYDPAPAIEKLLEQLEEEVDGEMPVACLGDDEQSLEEQSYFYSSFVTRPSYDFTELLLKLLYYEFEYTVKTLPKIARKLDECIAEANFSYWTGEIIVVDDDSSIVGEVEGPRYSDSREDTPSFSITKFIDKSMRELNKERKKRWIEVVDSSVEKYDRLRLLGFYFAQVYPVWEKAKELYKESQESLYRKKRMSWREDILEEYEKELKAFSDLIELLADPPEVPAEIYEKILKKGVTSAPKDIALQHAARLCGIPDFEYTTRHLEGILSKQGMSAKKVKSKRRV